MDITINKLDGRLVVALVGDLDNAATTKAECNIGMSPVEYRLMLTKDL